MTGHEKSFKISRICRIDDAGYRHASMRRIWRNEASGKFVMASPPPSGPALNPVDQVWRLTSRLRPRRQFFPTRETGRNEAATLFRPCGGAPMISHGFAKENANVITYGVWHKKRFISSGMERLSSPVPGRREKTWFNLNCFFAAVTEPGRAGRWRPGWAWSHHSHNPGR